MKKIFNQVRNFSRLDVVRFGFVGIVNTAIDFGLLNLFLYFGLNLFWALFFAYSTGAANGYLLNNHWTYRRLKQQSTVVGFLKYAAISFIGLGLTELIVYELYQRLHLNINLDKLVAVVIVFSWNFLANRFFTFGAVEPIVSEG